jgi:membrane protein
MSELEQGTELESPTEHGRSKRVLDWLRGRTDTAVGRLALQWFRAYFAASRNSGCAVTVYSALSVLPAALVFVAVLHPSSGDANAFAERLVVHMHLTGSTASLVKGTFGSASANKLAASLSVVVSFLLWGIGIGQLYQDVYARAWGVKVGSVADQGLFALFFFMLVAAVGFALVAGAWLRSTGWIVLIPAWLAASTAFWLVVPQLLLHRKVAVRELLPGAILATVVVGGTVAAAPFFLPASLNEYGKSFGSFGVVVTLIGYVFVLITISLVCAVFSPVWLKWRETERQLRESTPTATGGLVAP